MIDEKSKDEKKEEKVHVEPLQEEETSEEIPEEGEANDKEPKPEENGEDELQMKFLKIKDENAKLQNELDTYKDRLLRTAAEYDNFRRRTAKEKESIYTESCFDVLKDILPVLDNLERASEVAKENENIKKGIDMTINSFKDTLNKLGVAEIDASGKFDPNLHNAVMHVEDESYGEKEIVEVFQKGYQKGDKILRYSMVKVAN